MTHMNDRDDVNHNHPFHHPGTLIAFGVHLYVVINSPSFRSWHYSPRLNWLAILLLRTLLLKTSAWLFHPAAIKTGFPGISSVVWTKSEGDGLTNCCSLFDACLLSGCYTTKPFPSKLLVDEWVLSHELFSKCITLRVVVNAITTHSVILGYSPHSPFVYGGKWH